MWTTSDGHALTLLRSRFAPIILQMRKPEMKDLVKRNYQGDLKQAVVRSLGQLASNAHRTGNLRHRRSNRRYPVFTAGLNGREYEIITSPVGSTQNAIVSVSAEPDSELQWFATPARRKTTRPTEEDLESSPVKRPALIAQLIWQPNNLSPQWYTWAEATKQLNKEGVYIAVEVEGEGTVGQPKCKRILKVGESSREWVSKRIQKGSKDDAHTKIRKEFPATLSTFLPR
ncbi:MAG: hypothetical protein L0Y67_05705 [Gammaproteobacteria bacterium]|nr:hypothetical protein [Gammaproteobacteria bacterium]